VAPLARHVPSRIAPLPSHTRRAMACCHCCLFTPRVSHDTSALGCVARHVSNTRLPAVITPDLFPSSCFRVSSSQRVCVPCTPRLCAPPPLRQCFHRALRTTLCRARCYLSNTLRGHAFPPPECGVVRRVQCSACQAPRNDERASGQYQLTVSTNGSAGGSADPQRAEP